MEKSLSGQQNYFEAFIKAAQYLARLTSQQDIWSETGKVLVNFFGAEVGAVEESRANGGAAKRRWTFSEQYSGRRDLEAEIREAMAEVLESGFLSARIIFTPDPLSIACFPITWENQVIAVMVVGHEMPGPLPRELLNVYLAVAGLVGTTGERLASERELRRHRQQLEAEIAERKQAEEALRESEKRYRLVFENSPVSIWEEDFSGVKSLFDNLKKEGITDIETYFAEHPETVRQCAELARIVDVNQAALALHAAANKNELMANLVNTFTPESFDTFRQDLICLWNGGTEMMRDAIVKTLAGESRNVTVSFSVCPGYEDTLSKVLVSLTDITERKRAEEALRDSERRLAEAQRIAKIGNWEWDVLHNQLWWSDETFRLFEMNPQAFGATFESFINAVHPDDRERVQTSIRRALQHDPGGWQIDYRISRADGTLRFVHEEAETVFDQDGRPLKRLGTVQDITERKQAEEEIRKLNQELEQRVADRTAQLEAANKELEAFAYSVSHDLRAPLRHLDGFIEMLQKRIAATLDKQSQHYLDTIAGAARRMGLLIDDLLSFSRMGRADMAARPVELTPLVREVIRELESETRGRNIHWQIADLPVVMGDQAMLRIALMNLIANAVKFTRPRAQAKIEIGCQAGQDAETVVYIRDNGVGFDMQYVDRLFGVFQRLHRTDEFEGTGIGLANVRRIITRHGGRTWAEGQVNHGAAFYFSLPPSIQGAADGVGSVGGVPPSPPRHTPQMKPSGFIGDKVDE